MNDVSSDFRDHFYTSADGLKLYARDYPGADDSKLLPVLCLHGLTRNSGDFAWIASHLANNRRVISVDQRGRGRSEYDPVVTNYTPATYVGDMFKLLDELEIDRALIIGTSMGGLMSMIMTTLQPKRFAGVVVNDIGPELDPDGLDRIKCYVGGKGAAESWDEAVEQNRAINGVAFPHYTDEEWLRFTKGLYREVDGGLELAYDPAIAQLMRDDSSDALPADLWPLFQGMAALPILLVRGELTDILAMSCVEKMQEMSPTLTLLQVPDRGHAPMLDEPLVVRAIDEFFAGIDEAL